MVFVALKPNAMAHCYYMRFHCIASSNAMPYL